MAPATAYDEKLGDSFAGIAYTALWELHDLNPASEPAYFKKTRLDLHERLEKCRYHQEREPQGDCEDSPVAHLRIVK